MNKQPLYIKLFNGFLNFCFVSVFFGLVLKITPSHAQNFPVTSTPIVQGGSDMRWSSFYSSSEKIKLQLVLKDKDRPSLEVFLNLKIERAGIVIRTRQDLMPPQVSPITLSFGSAKLLNGPQMLEYFRPENLEVEGLDPAFLTQGGTLPDGLYSISVTAYEYDAARGHRQVSNTGYGFFAVYLGLPPIIQAPKDGAELPEMAVQNIMFQWLPRTAALPGGDGTQAYQFELFEVGPGEDAQQLANGSLTKVFTTTTSQPYLLYNPALANAPPLKPGGQYAIRVRVVSTDPSQGYQNDGYSQVVSFSYGTPCLPPTGISMALSNYLYDKISWLPQTGATGYTVQYKTEDATEWQSQELFSNFFENYNPKQAKTYQYKVMSRCSENRTSEAVNTSRNQSIKPSCQPPTDIVVTQTDQPNTVKLSWAAVAGAKDYTIHVKKGMLQALDEYTTGKTSLDITYTSKSFNANIRTNCSNGSSSYISASEYIPTLQQAKLASQAAFLKSAQPNVASSNPVDILNPFDIVVNSEGKGPTDVEDALRDLNDLKGQTQNPCTGTRIDDLLCLDTPATITAGTEPFGFGPNKKMYINHYDVIITAGMAAKGEGLLYLPLVKARIPVEWSGLQVNRSQTGDYGCVLAPGQVQMQGSQSGVISGDLFRQVMALLTQGPGSFSGKFGEALEAAKEQAKILLQKIAAGTPLTTEEIKKYKSACKAIDNGTDAYKKSITAVVSAPFSPALQASLTNIDALNQTFKDLADCDGYSQLSIDFDKAEKYAAVHITDPPQPLLVACQLANAEANAQDFVNQLELTAILLKPADTVPSMVEVESTANASATSNKKVNICCSSCGPNGTVYSVTLKEGLDYVLGNDGAVEHYIIGTEIYKTVIVENPTTKKREFIGFAKQSTFDDHAKHGTQLAEKMELKIGNSAFSITAQKEGKCDDFDNSAKGDYFTDAGLNKLKAKLIGQGADNTEITVKDCTDPTKPTKTVTTSDIAATAGQKNIQIEMCWDGSKWTFTHAFKPNTLNPQTKGSDYKGTAAEVEAASNEAANRVIANKGTTGYNSGDGELVYESMDLIEALVEVKEATIKLCNEAKVPDKYWNNEASPIKAPTLSGVGDGAIEEAKSIPELVSFGLQLATEPSVAQGLWNTVKTLTPSKVKKMLLGAGAEKLAKYTGGGNTMKHEAGKDGVTIAMMFFTGGVKKLSDGIDLMDDVAEGVGKKVDDFGEVISDGLGKNISEDAREVTLKGINDGDISKEMAEEINEEFKDATTKADKPWMENIIKGVKYGKRIDAKFDADDLDYLTEAASKIGNGVTPDVLKTFQKTKQLQIDLGNGKFTVADNVWFKKIDENNFEVHINETKLGSGTALTTRQNQFKSALTGGTSNFRVRSQNGPLAGKNITVKSFIKTMGNGSISDTFACEKLF